MRQALLKAAHQIETTPDSYYFDNGSYPVNHTCPSGVTCALGWVGFFADIKETKPSSNYWLKVALHMNIINERTGKPYMNRVSAESEFYRRMDELAGSQAWQNIHTICVKALRLYADKYYPVTQHSGLPDKVTKLFVQETQKELA